ncbi:hypothetical protein RhoFasK5_03732|nr:hypothetical protein [Rhodococcus kroppenstedtii]
MTDNAKPHDTANAGSTASSTITAVASAGIAWRRRPVNSASRPSTPITAARSTLGDGRAITTNATSASPASSTVARGPSVHARARSTTAPTRKAKLAPDTAVRWDIPASVKSSSTSGSNPDRSPTTMPGSRPADSGGNARSDAAVSAPRTAVAAAAHHGGSPGLGGPVGRATAATRPGRSGTARRARNVTGVPYVTRIHSAPVARTVRPAGPVTASRPDATRCARTDSTTRVAPAPSISRGSSLTTPSTPTLRPASAYARTGPVSTASTRSAAVPPKAAVSTSAAAATVTTRRRKPVAAVHRPHPAAIVTHATARTTAADAPAPTPSPHAIHAPTADGTNRRSGTVESCCAAASSTPPGSRVTAPPTPSVSADEPVRYRSPRRADRHS